MECNWAGGCGGTVTEVWTPKEGSKVMDGGPLGYCREHGLHGDERTASCTRRGYDLVLHRHYVTSEWFVSAFRGHLFAVPSVPLMMSMAS